MIVEFALVLLLFYFTIFTQVIICIHFTFELFTSLSVNLNYLEFI